ncbi:MAG: glycerol-3-phosphate acyltransferase [Meiothermus sp.]|uniref:glycerol-3-phosphate acyltransferase n=1 Tax=Meiothermus sp. TaxID=1955249 RepID=UPI0025FB22B0|nr:glycerol-3-phosphate acyltransferase [Meiothermus sp.]MCS7067919.1 glycerol-3-phosphate acyltransferase [Meiothermus sp.]MCX7601822.1 glycerol-3-phosphate acyltransferase [Meiothermus sp.]MDW8426131.1 glycerol-3-phosphate acyltransferase [Meiothermus sp.]
MDVGWVVVAYLVGSLSFGRIAGVLKGVNLAERDTPGASGTFRQLGAGWGIAVALADVLKGVLVAYLGQWAQAAWAMPLMGAALVAGHNWPIYFGFRGGGGIAPTLGFFGFLYPSITWVAVGIGLAVAGLYWQLYWKNHPQRLYPIPVGAIVGYLYALVAFWPTGAGFWSFLLVSLVVAVRGLGLLRRSR